MNNSNLISQLFISNKIQILNFQIWHGLFHKFILYFKEINTNQYCYDCEKDSFKQTKSFYTLEAPLPFEDSQVEVTDSM